MKALVLLRKQYERTQLTEKKRLFLSLEKREVRKHRN